MDPITVAIGITILYFLAIPISYYFIFLYKKVKVEVPKVEVPKVIVKKESRPEPEPEPKKYYRNSYFCEHCNQPIDFSRVEWGGTHDACCKPVRITKTEISREEYYKLY